MLKISPTLIERVQAAQKPSDLYALIQSAIELEHSTIPPYLAAYFTLKLGTNQPVADIIRSVVVEEMLHMTIAANLLIAIGGHPVIDKPGFVPTYPGPLPLNIGDLTVGIEKCSIDVIKNTFMAIEEPQDKIDIKSMLLAGQTYATIGAFYEALDLKLHEFGPPAFADGRFDQEVIDATWFPPDQLFPITDLDSASAGIKLIMRQGEGTATDPDDPEGEPAHYYRFQQIVKGRRLIRDSTAPSGWVYGGAPITLDTSNVWNMQPNPPPPDKLPDGSDARRAAIAFAFGYTSLLKALHECFNGAPGAMGRSIGLMYQLRLLAQTVLKIPLADDPAQSTGLSFVYQTTTA